MSILAGERVSLLFSVCVKISKLDRGCYNYTDLFGNTLGCVGGVNFLDENFFVVPKDKLTLSDLPPSPQLNLQLQRPALVWRLRLLRDGGPSSLLPRRSF